MWSATQIPHILKTLAAATDRRGRAQAAGDRAGRRRRFRRQAAGHARGDPRHAASRKLGKPVKWTETRSESPSAHHGRDQIQDITIAARRRHRHGAGRRPARRHGCLPALVTSGIPVLGAFMFNSIYKFPAYRFACTNVFILQDPTDAYRGAGRPEATFAIERIMDELAVELGREPMDVVAQNWIKHEEFPFTTVCGLQYDSGNYEAATAKAKELFDYDGLRRAAGAPRSGDPVQLGIGISTFTEMCGLAPSRVLGAQGTSRRLGDRVDPAAAVRQGRGRHRVVRTRAGPRDGLEPDRRGPARRAVRGIAEVLHGDTQVSHKGMDTYGSRSLVVGGIAVVKAAEKVVAKARTIAAHLLEASEDDLEPSAGASGSGHGQGRDDQEVATATFRRTTCPTGSSRRWTPTPPSTRTTSRSCTARTSPRWRSTPRRAG